MSNMRGWKRKSTNQSFNALNAKPKQSINVCSFMIAAYQVDIHGVFNLQTEQQTHLELFACKSAKEKSPETTSVPTYAWKVVQPHTNYYLEKNRGFLNTYDLSQP
jgi:hypothetical protein